MLRVLVDLSSALVGAGFVWTVQMLCLGHALVLGGGAAVKSLFCWSHMFWFAKGIYSICLNCRLGRMSGKDWDWA